MPSLDAPYPYLYGCLEKCNSLTVFLGLIKMGSILQILETKITEVPIRFQILQF